MRGTNKIWGREAGVCRDCLESDCHFLVQNPGCLGKLGMMVLLVISMEVETGGSLELAAPGPSENSSSNKVDSA